MVENKQKFISQIMTSKSPVRTAEDIDEASLSYAEIKALASGNPLIKEKMDLDIQVGKLKLEKATYLSQKYELEDRVLKYYPKRIAQLNEIIQEATMDMSKSTESEEFIGMDILGIHYPEKEQAGSALILACNKIKNTEETPIGSYRGFDMTIKYDSFHNGHDLYLKGQWKYKVDLGKSEFGNLTRIDNVIKSIPDIVDNAKSELVETEKQLENAKSEINKPFVKEEEFKMKSERLSELDKELDIGKGESEIDDAVLENDDEREVSEYSR